MVRISDILKINPQPHEEKPAGAPSAKTPETPSKDSPEPVKPAPVTPVSLSALMGVKQQMGQLRTEGSSAGAQAEKPGGASGESLEAQALYDQLLAAGRRCLEQAKHREPIRLGPLPELAEALVERLVAGNRDLVAISTVRSREFSLAHHGVNVAVLLVLTGMASGFSRAHLLDLALVGLLHDVGMIRFQPLVEGSGTLNPHQRQQLREHPLLGQRILKASSEVPSFVSEIAVQEHERHDGSGYPNRLSGVGIHEHAQLLGMVDMYESLTHDRPFRTRLLPSHALATVVRDSRHAFSRRMLRSLLESVAIYPEESWVRLTTGDLAQVLENVPRRPFSPKVKLFNKGADGTYREKDVLNLAARPGLFVESAVVDPAELAAA